MLFFKTIDATIPLTELRALSRSGSTLQIYHAYTDKPILSKPETPWELEDYTQQWADLLEQEEARYLEIEPARRAEYQAAAATATPAPVAVKVPQGNIPSKADPVPE